MNARTLLALRRGRALVSSVALGLACMAIPIPSVAADDDRALTNDDMGKVAHWIAGRVAAARQPYCWRQSYGRGVGKAVHACGSDEDKDGALCYPTCKSGYYGVGPVCWQHCPGRYTDIGVSCAKPKPYGRGAGHETKHNCEHKEGTSCSKYLALWYPDCRDGFHHEGCCICSPSCPDGMRDDGEFCAKGSYGRGAGKPMRCGSDEQEDAALCYTPCRSEFHGVGPVCWQNCPSGRNDCAAGCTLGKRSCISDTANMVIAPAMLAVNIFSDGSSSGFMKEYEQVLNQAKQYKNDATFVYNYAKTIDLWASDFIVSFAKMTTPEVAQQIQGRFSAKAGRWVARQYAMHHLALMLQSDGIQTAQNTLNGISGYDPSGVTAVIAAFSYPKCALDEPFPSVSPLY